MEAVSNYRQKIQFIVGFAGSGKSTKLAEIASSDVLVLTPTHKAIAVLEAKGVENVFTIYSVLKLVPTLNQNFRKGQKLQALKRIGGIDLADITKIIIDEYSMIPTSVLDLLLEVLPGEAKIIVMGDPYQLPPVDGEAVDFRDYTTNVMELTTQHRAEAPEVVETFMRFYQWLKDKSEKDLRVNLPIIDTETMTDLFDPKTDRILAFTNKRVIELNSMIEKPTLKIGDTILLNGLEATIIEQDLRHMGIYPAMISKGKLKPELRANIELNLNKYNGWDFVEQYPSLNVKIGEQKYTVSYDLDHYAENKSFENNVKEAQYEVIEKNNLDVDIALPKWCRANGSATGVKARGKAWSSFISHRSHIFDLRYPFCTTVHKAQGSEFKTVFIDQKNMKRAVRNGHIEQYVRLMYVALSRAVKKVYIVQ